MTAAKKPCPWHKEALAFGQQKNTWDMINPHKNPATWAKWRDYFRWLNWAPYWFLEVERQHDINPDCQKSWTAPITDPDDFKINFKPAHGPTPRFPMEETKRFRDAMHSTTREERQAHIDRVMGARRLPPNLPRGSLANLFVGRDKPRFEAMVERAKTADPAEWCWYENHPKWGSGIKVPLNWYHEDRKPWLQSLTPAAAQAFLDANEFKP